MRNEKTILAFDFGASSGRAVLATLKNSKVEMEEIHRFSNEPVYVSGHLYWDVLRLLHEIKQGIIFATQHGGFDSIGIDTWGVDFGLIDENGDLISNPFHYRDVKSEDVFSEIFSVINKDELYKKTGIQHMNFNTVFQLFYISKYRPDTLKRAEVLLLMPDLFAYFLTGKKRMEYTEASTTGLLNVLDKKIDNDILSKLEIPKNIFPKMIQATEKYGCLSDEICEELHCEKVPVFAVATHDTASAVLSVPSSEDDYAYISCGTWSLFGTICDNPILTDDKFTNEGAFGNKICYLKNIMGLWLLQQSRAEYKRRGLNVSFDEMEKQAKQANPFVSFIDPDNMIFNPPGDMPTRVGKFCKQTNQPIPENMGETLLCIYQSLAFKYKYSFENLKINTGKDYSELHMVGGGIKDEFLCQMTANACGVPVIAGPTEATITGNVIVQMMGLKLIDDLKSAKEIIKNSTQIKIFNPQSSQDWTKNYPKFLKVL